MNAVWRQVWKVVAGVGVAAGAVASTLTVFGHLRSAVARRWFKRREVPRVPSRKCARRLKKLVKHLGRAQEWFGSLDCEMARTLDHELGRVTWKVWAEVLSYVALYSANEERQCLALRNLSQVKDAGAVDHVKGVIKGVEEYPFTHDRVRRVAEAALRELERREKIRKGKNRPATERDAADGTHIGETE